jgi:FlaA1/EpsC-like NDP-sugar epimerase
VIQAGAMARRGELFVLNMGRPVKIYDLAVSMIQLSGLELDRDIRIEEVGLRPGEKLYEELLMKTEQMEKTANDLIYIERDTPYTRAEVDEKIRVLLDAINGNKSVRDAIARVVPTYCEAETVNSKAEQSEEMKWATCI